MAYKYLHDLIPAILVSTLPFFLAHLNTFTMSNVLPLIFELWFIVFVQPITLSSWFKPQLCPHLLLTLHFTSTFSKKPSLVPMCRLGVPPWYSQHLCILHLITFLILCYPWIFLVLSLSLANPTKTEILSISNLIFSIWPNAYI